MITRSLSILFLATLFFLAPQLSLASSAQLGEQLVPFSQKDMEGNLIDMNTIIGKKPVMLVFWASWCPSCKVEAPEINKLVEKFGPKGMEFIGINVGFNDSEKRAKAFVKKHGINYPTIFNKNGDIAASYMVQGVPTIVVADKNGTILFRNFGTPDITEENFNLLSGN